MREVREVRRARRVRGKERGPSVGKHIDARPKSVRRVAKARNN